MALYVRVGTVADRATPRRWAAIAINREERPMRTKKSTSGKSNKAGSAAKALSTAGTEKARKAAIAEIQQRLEGKPGGARNANNQAGKAPKVSKAVEPKRLSALDAAAQVIAGASKPMRAKDLIEQMEAKSLWKSPGGKTPEATLYAAIIREIAAKGAEARFKRHGRGTFMATQRN